MLRLLFVFATILALSNSASIPTQTIKDDNGRIVGGKLSDITKHPHQISIRYKKCGTCSFKHICGGTIVSDKIILTAAHCVVDNEAKYMHVVAGTNERTGHGIMVPVKNFVYHEDFYKLTPFDNDVAILVLDVELPLNGYDIKAIEMTETRPLPYEIAQVTGWGQVSEIGALSDLLLEVEVSIIPNEICEARFDEGRINPSMLCAGTAKGGKDACSGDSGGPLLVNGVLVGVVSWGDGCARAEFPGVYASVADLRPWIDAAIKANS
ncbi:trypsin zeta-like [Episyrphus balteatus]|uniref:trypsin zeta-like n=1 Tax=Episyrphus balteatus TaxID=286459 RepID=UPI002486946F|nr:trypsin zeta-like [Episyrphus balteatus]